MYHYCYLLKFPNGMQYIGARSTELKPELDTTYLGSGRALPHDRHSMNVSKTILKTFGTREECMEFERSYIIEHSCHTSDDWYNQRTATYDRHGETPWNKGMTMDFNPRPLFTERYGKGYRTPAQIAGAASMRAKLTGVKNPAKGKPGTANNGFKPWYSISPDGVYTEHTNETKQEFAAQIGVTPRQLIHRFHHTNEHKKARTKPLKGWVFGNL